MASSRPDPVPLSKGNDRVKQARKLARRASRSEQRLFLGWSQVWCQNITDEAARLRAQTDPHSPGEFRVNGVLSNMPAFRKAFGCKVGQPMAPENMCRVW